MSGVVRFALAAVVPLLEHARAAPGVSPTLGQMLSPEFQLPSAKGKSILEITADDVDPSKLPRQLFLVKDRGCYLMSAGKPGLLVADQPPGGTQNVVVYGEGFGPDADWDTVRDVCGGDDFAEGLQLEIFQRGITAGADYLDVHFYPDQLEFSYSHADSPAVLVTG